MNKFRALLIGFAATVGAGGIAAYNGVFDRAETPAQGVVSQPATEAPKAETPATAPAAGTPTTEAPKAETAPAQDVAKAVAEPEPAAPAATPAETQPTAEASPLAAPSFDVLRVEPDGSVLIAGKAGENAQVEVLSGANVLGVAKAQANGDFAITLADPLKPGDYQLVLRATGDDGKSANSAETATVSVPEQKDGPVLALVEEAGEPSRIITAPEIPQETTQAETPATEANQPATAEVQVSGEVKAPEAPAAPAASSESVAIEAVETEEGKIFIAGSAKGVATVRIYANDQVLGDAKPDAGDRFLGEFQRELAPGDYIFKAEGLAADGVTVISRATVPFQQQSAQPEAATPGTEPATPAETAQADGSAATAEQAAPAAKPMAVIIRRGDTLWQISRRIYGRGVRYSTIYLANEGVTGDPNRIFPGQVFKVPEKTPEGEAADAIEVEKRAAPEENSAQ